VRSNSSAVGSDPDFNLQTNSFNSHVRWVIDVGGYIIIHDWNY
jgi:hypothetical protein